MQRPASFTLAQALLFAGLVLLVQVVLAASGVNDLDLFLAAGTDLLAGKPVYRELYNGAYSYFYGPVLALLLHPLTLLPPWVAKLLWGVLSLGALLRSLQLLGRWNGAGSLSPHQQALSLLAVLAFMFQAVRDNLNAGQTTFLMVWAMLEAISFAGRGKWIWAALLLAFGMDIKLLPVAVWAYLLYGGHWRTALLTPVFLGALAWGVPSVLFGPTRATDLLHDRWTLIDPGTERHILDEEEPDFLSIGAVLSAYLSADGGNQNTVDLPRRILALPLDLMVVLIPLARLALASSMLLLLGWPPFRGRPPDHDAGREIGWLFGLIPLVFPHQQTYSLLFVLPAMAFLSIRWWRADSILRHAWAKALLVLAYACLNAHLWLGHFGPVYDHYKVPVLGLVAVGVLLALDRPRDGEAGVARERPSASAA